MVGSAALKQGRSANRKHPFFFLALTGPMTIFFFISVKSFAYFRVKSYVYVFTCITILIIFGMYLIYSIIIKVIIPTFFHMHLL